MFFIFHTQQKFENPKPHDSSAHTFYSLNNERVCEKKQHQIRFLIAWRLLLLLSRVPYLYVPSPPAFSISPRYKNLPIFLSSQSSSSSSSQSCSGMGIKGFVEGGIASIIAGCSTHPLDLIKVRMQLQGETHVSLSIPTTGSLRLPPPPTGPFAVGLRILQQEGAAAIFSGISATVLRQTLYSTTRMGIYDTLKQKWSEPISGQFPLLRKISAGLIAGGIGAAVGNPADVAMVRMQADGRLPAAERRNYKGVGEAIRRMWREEGVGSLWRGSSLTVNRAMLVTASQLASYDELKEVLVRKGARGDGVGTHVAASMGAGVVAAVVTNPVDVVKTRVMNMKVDGGGMAPYQGAVDCAVKTMKAEGVMAFYKGFVPTVCRQGPFTVVLFVTLEQVRKLLKNF